MAKTSTPISPSQKLGTDSPISATLLAAQLAGPRRRTAAISPAPTPISAAIAMANMDSCRVTGMACPIELATGSPVREEVPRSPCRALPTYLTYCTGMG